MDTVEVGLALVAVGWAAQLACALKGVRRINAAFLTAYVLGCALLAADALAKNMASTAYLNAACSLLAAGVLAKTLSESCCRKAEKK